MNPVNSSDIQTLTQKQVVSKVLELVTKDPQILSYYGQKAFILV